MFKPESGDYIEQSQIEAGRDVIGKVVHSYPPPAPPPPEGDESWRAEVGYPPLQADCFQTRELVGELARIVGEGRTAVLSGMGGVGKTQLAVQYAEQAWDAGEANFRTWITAVSREAVISDYAASAETLGLVRPGTENERACRRFLEWLNTTRYRWLIVLDDVQDPTHLTGLWPPIRPDGRTVVTTRRQDAALRGHQRQTLQVGLFTTHEAEIYLHRKLDNDPAITFEAAQLAADLGYLPLALAHAAAYISDQGLSCADYRHRLSDRRTALAELLPDDEQDALPDGYERTVAAAWSLSIDRANELKPAGLARPLLELASVLDPNGVPATLFTTDAARTYLADMTPAYRPNVVDVEKALHNLRRLSLAQIDSLNATANAETAARQRNVRVHALVQRATRDTIHDLATTTRAGADGLVEIWPRVESDTRLGADLRANTEILRMHAQEHLYSPDAHPVLFRAGLSIGEAGFVTAATRYFSNVVAHSNRVLGPDDSDTLIARHHLARWQGELGDATGIAAFEELLGHVLRVLGPNHPQTLASRHNLARCRLKAGDAAGAAAAFEELLSDQLRVQGPDHPHTLAARGNLATCRSESGDVAGAAAAYEELLSDQLRVEGPGHPDTLVTLHNLVSCRSELDDAAGAAAAFEKLHSYVLHVVGPDHPQTLAARHHLASWRGKSGDAAHAAVAFEELLGDQLRVQGPDHPDTLSTRHDLAHWRGYAGDVVRAITELEELLGDQLRVQGPDHPDTLSTRHLLVSWRGESGDAARAAESLMELLSDHLRVLDPDHPQTLAVLYSLARWRGRAGDDAGAAAAFEELLSHLLRLKGQDHPETLSVRSKLVYWRGRC